MTIRFESRGAARLFSVLMLAAAALPGLSPVHAATPAAGTLSDGMTVVNYKVGTTTTSNPTPVPTVDDGPRCNGAAFPCDSFKLTVTMSQAYIDAHPGYKARVTLNWDVAASDYDLHIFDGDVATTDGSVAPPYGSASSSNPEIAYLPLVAGTRVYTIKSVPYTATPADTVAVKVDLVSVSGAADPCAGQFGLPSGSATLAPEIAKAFSTRLDTDLIEGFVHFREGDKKSVQDALVKAAGLTLQRDFRAYASSAYVVGPVAGFRALAGSGRIGYIEANQNLRYLGDTASWATRARVAQEAVSGGPYYDANRNRLTGKGSTVCVVDSGVFGAHPDFTGRIQHNYKIPGTGAAGTAGVIDVGATDSDTTGGHGTHCAGIAVGGGNQSTAAYGTTAPLVQGTYAGAAPEANLVMYGAGEGLNILAADTAFEHILENYDPKAADRIRVVSNSYGATGGTAYNPADTSSCLARALVNKGISVVFAASNDGGDGTADKTSPTCKDPTPGVICVASYNDQGTGGLNNSLSDFSSRGKKGKPETYPDIAAPGDLITSTCAQPVPGQAVCATGAETKWQPWYGTISGTSMATPHVAGLIALLYQARPDLTPAEVERLLQNTARKVGGEYEDDPQNPGGTINVGYGAGLVDLKAALDALGVAHGTLPVLGAEYTIFDGDTDTLVPSSAGDAVKLTMQEVSGIPSGIQYRLTLAGTALGTGGYTYTVEGNYNGEHYTTQVALTSTGASALAKSSANTAPASGITLTGSTLSFFVPYSALGRPPVATPVHSLRVVVTDSNGLDIDYAPSPATVPAAVAALMPAYGRAFTVQTAATGGTTGGSTETPCVAPGLTVATDPAGDNTDAGVPGHDVLAVNIAEPYSATAAEKLVFTLKVDAFTVLPPNTLYFIYFNLGDGLQHYVSMDASNPAAPSYIYGHIEPPAVSGGVGSNVDDGSLDADSGYDGTKGTITFVLTKSKVAQLATTKTLTTITGEARLLVGVLGTGLITRLDASAAGSYTQVGHAYCAPDAAPVAKLVATPVSGTVPFDVEFDGSGSTDPDAGDSITAYTFDYGDGTAAVTQAASKATHRYTSAGRYTAKLTVTDSHGKASSAAATAVITANAPTAGNTAPTARLVATPASGTAPLTVTLDASGSTDPDAGDSIASYTFDFGDGSATVTQTGSSVRHDYAAGSYTATVTVTDTHGATAGTSVTVAAGAPAQVTLTPSPDHGEVPLPVTLTANATPPVGATIVSYVFYFGDGSDPTTVQSTAATTSLSHTYTGAGSFAAQVVSNYSDGSGSVSQKQTITATTSVTVTPSDRAVAVLEVSPNSGSVPLTVHFDGSRSFGANGNPVTTWTFDFGDGVTIASSQPKVDHVYTKVGSFSPTLSVTDSKNNVSPEKAMATVKVVEPVGGTTPVSGSPDTGGRTGGGGAFGPGLLLPLLAVALRRRRRPA